MRASSCPTSHRSAVTSTVKASARNAAAKESFSTTHPFREYPRKPYHGNSFHRYDKKNRDIVT